MTIEFILKISGIIFWITIAIIVILSLVYKSNSKYQIVAKLLLGTNLSDSIENLTEEFSNKEVSNKTISNVASNLILRITRIGALGIIISGTPIILLYQQNQLFESQNKKIEFQVTQDSIQSDLLKSQNELIETERRSSLIVLLSNTLDQLDKELNSTENIDGSLSPTLIRRISALTKSLRPYKFYEDGETTEESYSPEKGHLLNAITKVGINEISLHSIFYDSDFNNIYLKKTDFSYSTLEDIEMNSSTLGGSNFYYANLSNASLYNCELGSTILKNANLSKAFLNKSSFVNSILDSANLSNAQLRGTQLGVPGFGGLISKMQI